MFTGIVHSLGTVVETGTHHLVVAAPTLDEPLGASIAVNGCCLTVVSRATDGATRFDLLPETLSHTNLGQLTVGDRVNLEPALRAGDAMGGHWVQGHVDATGRVRACRPDASALDVELELPESVLRYCIDRGSITVNGVSLTVMGLLDDGIRISLIPETRERTNLGDLQEGFLVNLEADILARYVERLISPRA